ncbi:hypothetical protein DFQ28_004143 [Apophysomyces sp. BC1034]|nr:hypothetical protein DFQ30_004077 [Apophysomyces sp. BC1015]KAG0178595.1 hypothetical protein DFQ29_003253 [Apophysomyces sp. BC1021]KAG0188940.1 hypothetical protein DFQ28_004143 [Apophysomyces sp. BC1034]
MTTLILLDDSVLIRLANLLELRDIIQLSRVNMRLQQLVYNSPEVWTSNLLFPVGDRSITDQFIMYLVPRITRHYGIQALRLVDLPLTWTGYLWIFDQFAHSVDCIDLTADDAALRDLARHLLIFAGNLAMLQNDNKIPITFRQYAVDDREYTEALAATDYLGQRSLRDLHRLLSSLKLDDPPFERLVQFRVSSTDHHPPKSRRPRHPHRASHNSPLQQEQEYDDDEDEHIHQLQMLASFLAGRTLSHKRPREDDPALFTKHRRHDLTISSIHQNQHQRHCETSSGA